MPGSSAMALFEIFRVKILVSQAMGELVNPTPKPELGRKVRALAVTIDGELPTGPMRQCLHAGLWILADELDKAHQICQGVANNYGSAWHAVVHRRDGDFENSKYWWRQAQGIKWEGIGERLAGGREDTVARGQVIGECMAAGRYDPAKFVDRVHHARDGGAGAQDTALVAIQRAEWMVLFEECWRMAADH